jgi:hypothetical protein
MPVDMNEATLIKYQNDRLTENAALKTVNEGVGFLLRIMGDLGDLVRVRLKKKKKLKLRVRNDIGKAYRGREGAHVGCSRQRTFPSHLLGAHAGFERWCPRCGTSRAYLGADRVH